VPCCDLQVPTLSTAYSLSIHCLFTVYSLSITVYSLSIHCLFTVYSLSIRCPFTAYSLFIQYLFTVYSLSIHCLFTVSCLFTVYSLSIHCLFTAYLLSIHCLFTVCSLSIHYLFIVYSLSIHCLFICLFAVYSLELCRHNPLHTRPFSDVDAALVVFRVHPERAFVPSGALQTAGTVAYLRLVSSLWHQVLVLLQNPPCCDRNS
jgi:hypothetical protein